MTKSILKFWIYLSLSTLALLGCQKTASPQSETKAGAAAEKTAPALWKVSDEDTTIYLFGTIHILQKDLDWRGEVFETAWQESPVVYFETNTGGDGERELVKLVPQLGYNAPETQLQSFFSEKEWAEISDTSQQLGIPAAQLQGLRPWLAGVLISVQMIVTEGGDPQAGVEHILEEDAAKNNKSIRYFETPEQQLRFFADMSDEDSADLLMDGLEFYRNNPDYFNDLVALWMKGDVKGIGDILIEGLSGGDEFAHRLLYNRNKAWVEELSRLLEEEQGVYFVAIGAGHLAGDKSVQHYLSKNGFKAERL